LHRLLAEPVLPRLFSPENASFGYLNELRFIGHVCLAAGMMNAAVRQAMQRLAAEQTKSSLTSV
jgi:hypothetical protein